MLDLLIASSDSTNTTVAKEMANEAVDTAETVADSAIDQLAAFKKLFSFLELGNLVDIAVRLVVIILVLTAVYRSLRYVLNRAYATRAHHVSAGSARQLETARHMAQSAIFYCFIILGIIATMSIFGFDMRGLAASAGIAGAALVLISQSIILDWISGLFILVEHQFNVGDYVKLGDYCGVVKSISIRQTVIITDNEETVTIPNGNIKVVINYSQAPVVQFLDLRIYDASRVSEGRAILARACDTINARYQEQLVEPCRELGVQDIVGPAVVLRIVFKSGKDDTYGILRALREEALKGLSAAHLQLNAEDFGKEFFYANKI